MTIWKKIACIPVQNLVELEVYFDRKIGLKEGFYSVAINAEKIIRCDENIMFSRIIEESCLPVPDGVAAIMLLRKRGVYSIKVDLPSFVIQYCLSRKLKLCLVGSNTTNNAKACSNLRELHSSLNLIDGINGYLDFNRIIQTLKSNTPDVVLLGLGSPKQEIFSSLLLKEIPDLVVINSGGAIDVISGQVKRAPNLIQKLNLEWLFRLVLQPWRIKRYFNLYKIIPIYLKA